MARITTNYHHKTIGTTIPGELFRTNFQGKLALCVNIECINNKRFIAVLTWEKAEFPFYYVSEDGSYPCLSYGTDWIIDTLLGPESFPRNNYDDLTPGTLYLDQGVALLKLHKLGGDNSLHSIEADILGAGRQDVGRHAVPVGHWLIWASEAERNLIDASPVVQFGQTTKNRFSRSQRA